MYIKSLCRVPNTNRMLFISYIFINLWGDGEGVRKQEVRTEWAEVRQSS